MQFPLLPALPVHRPHRFPYLLRVWYHGDPAGRWAEFRRKYLDELGSSAAMQDFLDRIRTYPDVTLLYASKNRVENHAVILKEFIEKNLN